jgi:hypothetical protein
VPILPTVPIVLLPPSDYRKNRMFPTIQTDHERSDLNGVKA